jgi:hypothetical protein
VFFIHTVLMRGKLRKSCLNSSAAYLLLFLLKFVLQYACFLLWLRIYLIVLFKLEKLDTDLKNYKSNSIKESIRRGHDDLGDHYLDCGDLSNALKCYSRARDYCTSGKHVGNMCLNVIKVCFITCYFVIIKLFPPHINLTRRGTQSEAAISIISIFKRNLWYKVMKLNT